MRPDRNIETCPSCRGRTTIPAGYGYYRECPSCAGQGFTETGGVSAQQAARVRREAAEMVYRGRGRPPRSY